MKYLLEKFLPILIDLSIMGSLAIVFVLILRILLKEAPKIYLYALWIVVLFRLLCPFSFESEIAIMPSEVDLQTQTSFIKNEIMPTIVYEKLENPEFFADNIISTTEAIIIPIWLILMYIWVLGITIMILSSAIALLKTKKTLTGCILLKDNIYLADNIKTPFVLGCFKPKIYLPSSINDSEIDFIIMHEKVHIKRLDHITRILAFVALCMHWFNPLVWSAYTLSAKDMEMSCDESVMSKLGEGIKKEYASSLLHFEVQKHLISPLAFSESDTKGRVKNIMKHKKTKVWVSILCVVLVSIFIFMLVSNSKNEEQDLSLLNPVMLANYTYQLEDYVQVTAEDGFVTKVFRNGIVDFLRDNKLKRKDMNLIEMIPSYTFDINGIIVSLYSFEPDLVKLHFSDIEEYRYYTKDGVYDEFLSLLKVDTEAPDLVTYTTDGFLEEIAEYNSTLSYNLAYNVTEESTTEFRVPKELYEELMFEILVSSSFLPTDLKLEDITQNYFYITSGLSELDENVALYIDETGKPMALRPSINGLTPISVGRYKEIEKVSITNQGSNTLITGYINIKDHELIVDQVEIILADNIERIEELELVKETHYPSGYYIHNEINKIDTLKLTDETKFIFTDFEEKYVDKSIENKLYETISIDEFIHASSYQELDLENLKDEHYIPYFIEIQNGVVVSITEDFRFTI